MCTTNQYRLVILFLSLFHFLKTEKNSYDILIERILEVNDRKRQNLYR